MIQVGPSTSFEATYAASAASLVGTITVAIKDNGSTVTAPTTSGIVADATATKIYTATLTSPSTAGTYQIVWNEGNGNQAVEDLVVSYTASSGSTPSGTDLCTLADVREFLQKPTSDTSQDAVIQSLITRASSAVSGYCEREFTPTTGATRTFECEIQAQTFLSLAPYDLRSVTSVQVDTDNTAVTLSASEYRLAPLPAVDGVYTAIRLNPFSVSYGSVVWRNRQVQITGDWGFASIPADVRHATIVTVTEWLRKDVQAFSTSYNVDAGILERPEALPRAVCGTLDSYRRYAL